MVLMLRKGKYTVYDDDGKVVIICHHKRICKEYAEQIQTSNVGHFSEKEDARET